MKCHIEYMHIVGRGRGMWGGG